MPDWLRALGLNPMSLGLDLRGGVYVLLEVDMESAIESRMNAYVEDISDRLRDERIRSRVEFTNGQISVRLQTDEDTERARELIEEADPELLILDGADGRSLRVRMELLIFDGADGVRYASG